MHECGRIAFFICFAFSDLRFKNAIDHGEVGPLLLGPQRGVSNYNRPQRSD
jgi:hypothetical protein